MKKQLLKTMLCLFSLSAVNQIKAQITLVEPPGSQSQDVARVSTVGNQLFFVGREEGGSATDIYLWSSDGITSTKIKLLSQVAQNISCSYFFPCAGKGFFFYSDGVSASGYEPWVTDGTAAGTMMIKDIKPGTGNSVLSNGLQECHCYNNKVYFGADDGVNGNELWVSDGTSAGTTLVKDIKTGSGSSSISQIIDYKSEMYFTAKSGNYAELWHSNGTTAGTIKIPNPSNLQGYQTGLVLHDTSIYFGGSSISTTDLGIWKTNGTTVGTTSLTGTLPLTPLNAITSIFSSGPDLYFGWQYFSAGYAYRLYKTNSLSSFAMLRDSVYFNTPSVLGTKVIFRGYLQGSGSTGEPWVTDATLAGRTKLNPVNWAISGTFRNVSPAFNNKIYFGTGTQLWETNGTVAGTLLNTATTGSVWDFAVITSTLFLNAQNPSNTNRQELYKIGSSTGINENSSWEELTSMYPQPANESLTIVFSSDTKEVEAHLMDVTGKELKTEILIVSDNKTHLNVGNVAAGLYLLQLKTKEGKISTKKIVVGK